MSCSIFYGVTSKMAVKIFSKILEFLDIVQNIWYQIKDINMGNTELHRKLFFICRSIVKVKKIKVYKYNGEIDKPLTNGNLGQCLVLIHFLKCLYNFNLFSSFMTNTFDDHSLLTSDVHI